MQKLHLVGFTTDHKGLIFSARRGSKSGGFVVSLDDDLVAIIDEARNWVDEDEELEDIDDPRAPEDDRPQSTLTVREVQSRLRAGRSVTEVAAAAGVDSEWVTRFAAPVLAEQSEVIARVRSAWYETPRRGRSAAPIGSSVYRNVAAKGVRLTVDELDDRWSARNMHGEVWVVSITYESRGRDHTAQWEWDGERERVRPLDRLASSLSFVDGDAMTLRLPTGRPVAEADDSPKKKRAAKKKPAKKRAAKKKPVKKKPAKKRAAKKRAVKKKPVKKRAAKKKPASRRAAKKKPAKKKRAGTKRAANKGPAPAEKRPAKKRSATKRAAPERAPRKRAAPAKKRAPGERGSKKASPSSRRAPKKRPSPRPPAGSGAAASPDTRSRRRSEPLRAPALTPGAGVTERASTDASPRGADEAVASASQPEADETAVREPVTPDPSEDRQNGRRARLRLRRSTRRGRSEPDEPWAGHASSGAARFRDGAAVRADTRDD